LRLRIKKDFYPLCIRPASKGAALLSTCKTIYDELHLIPLANSLVVCTPLPLIRIQSSNDGRIKSGVTSIIRSIATDCCSYRLLNHHHDLPGPWHVHYKDLFFFQHESDIKVYKFTPLHNGSSAFDVLQNRVKARNFVSFLENAIGLS